MQENSGSVVELEDDRTTNTWRQNTPATTGFAVFGADYTGPVSGSDVDWKYADFQYTDAEGYTVNTASYGAGAWQYTSSDYDAQGNVVQSLDEDATHALIALGDTNDAGVVDPMSTQTVYNDVVVTGGQTVLPAGTVVTDTYEPAHTSVLSDGTIADSVRQHTRTVYDAGAPNSGLNPATGQRYTLPTSVIVSASDSTGVDISGETISTTNNSYDKINASDANEGDGWTLGSPTKVTVGSVASVNRFDKLGRTIETRQPLSNGSDAGTTKTLYYTTGANSVDSACGNRPEWAGLTCRTYPAAAPTTSGTAAAGATTLPDERTTYDRWLNPTQTVEASGGATRTTTTGYDGASRQIKTATTSTISGSTAQPGTFTKYVADTGLISYRGTLNSAGDDATTKRTTFTYDAWGRETRRITDLADTINTTYDASSRPTQVTDDKGTTAMTYDSADERRGMVTKQTVTRSGNAGDLSFEATYDESGALQTQTLPGGIKQTNTYDPTGSQTGLAYAGQVTPLVKDDSTGETTPGTPTQGAWIAFSQDNDATGRARSDYSTDGAAFTSTEDEQDTAPVGQAGAYNRRYTYDEPGRLVRVDDQTASTTSDFDTDVTGCVRREYTFDNNSRRTGLSSRADGDADCSTGTVTSKSYSYDTADRPTTGTNGSGTYTYDTFGRQSTMPAADAPDAAGGNITLGYFDLDAVRSIAQNGITTTFTLDADGRRSVQTTAKGSATTTVTRHYAGSDDNPAWVDVSDGTATTTTRFVDAIGGDLGVTIGPSATSVALANMHGDVVSNVSIPSGQASGTSCTTISSWSDYTEFGAPRDSSASKVVGGVLGYGWLGTKERSVTDATAGLSLMGARLYNSTRGLFTSVDPVAGGTSSAYAYVNDPINQADITGMWWHWRSRNYGFRRWVNRTQSRVLGWGYRYANRRLGARCYRSRGMNICHGARYHIWGRGGTTLGNTYATSNYRGYRTRARIAHERVHVRQWNRYGWGFALRYLRAGSNPCRNRYERQAGLRRGGYRC